MIVGVRVGGVAEAAGIQRGSVIVKVNGVAVQGRSARDIAKMTTGPSGS